MKRLISAIVVVLLTGSSLDAQKLTRKQQELADELISQVARGSSMSILKSAVKLGHRANPQQREAINAYLSAENVPQLAELAANARYMLVLQGHARALPKPNEPETRFAISVFEEKTKDALAQLQEHELMQKTLPILDAVESYQDLFWDIHVLENQMQNAYKTVTYGNQLVKFAQRFKTNEEQQAVSTDFSALAKTLERLSQELVERKIELRLDRLQLSGELLHESNEFRPRLFAARAVDVDGELVTEFFCTRKNQAFSRERLNEPDLASVVSDEVKQFREQAGDLLEKSRLFASGLHWWKRGRYGRGSEGNGILKPIEAARSPQAAFGLYMPAETPLPTDPYEMQSEQVPQLARRHHYIWMYEYRNLRSATSSFSGRPELISQTPTSRTTLGFFW